MGFADYSQPIIRPGYNKAATDKILNKHRQNAEFYKVRICELDEELKLVTKQRDATREAFYSYLEYHGIEINQDELNLHFEKHMNEMSVLCSICTKPILPPVLQAA